MQSANPSQSSQLPENGPIRFGEAWAGTFINGVEASWFADVIDLFIDDPNDPKLTVHLRELEALLRSSDEIGGGRVLGGMPRALKPFNECLAETGNGQLDEKEWSAYNSPLVHQNPEPASAPPPKQYLDVNEAMLRLFRLWIR